MAQYRGVSATDIAESIQNALALLRAHSTGRELDAFCAYTEAHVQPGKIARQRTDESLAAYMQEMGKGIFSQVAELVVYHARFDTGGKGRAVLEDLQRWGGMAGSRLTVHTQMDEEIDRYILARYIETAIAHQGGARPPRGDELVVLDTQHGNDDEDEIYARLDLIVRHVAAGDESAARRQIGMLNLNQRHRVRKFMETAFDAELGNMALPQNSLFDLYGIVVAGGLQGFSGSEEADALVEKFNKAAAPLKKAGEVEDRLMVGIIADFGQNDPRSREGLSFIATRKGAEGIANAFPERTICNSKGETVKPRARRKKSGMRPARS